MPYPPLVAYKTEQEYRLHFEKIYCRGPVVTFDKISVRFRKQDFDHVFFESVGTKDDTFSHTRAQRIEWIKVALEDPASELYVGWNNKKKRHDHGRRVAVVMSNYVVVISISKKFKGRFITAFLADSGRTLRMIRGNPKWTKKNR